MVGKEYQEDLGGVPHTGDEVKRISTLIDGEPEASAAPPAPPANQPPTGGGAVCRCRGTGMVEAIVDAATGAYLGNDRTLIAPERKVREYTHPCPGCRPEQFARYENGCFRRDHDRETCNLCASAKPIPGGTARRGAR